MVAIEIKGVNKVRKRLADGSIKIYYYHRAARAPLKGKPGSPQFMSDYQAAERAKPYDNGTLNILIRDYSLSLQFDSKAASTQREYKRIMKKLEATFGDMPIVALGSPRVRGAFTEYQEEIGRTSRREADSRLTMLATILAYARQKDRIAQNPLEGFRRLYKGNRSELIWREAEVEAFMKDASVELQRAMILALHTGQRYGDLIRLRWVDFDGENISLKQSKTKRRVKFRCTPALKRMLDECSRLCEFILTRPDGRPWHTNNDDKALGKAWTERMKAAGLYHADSNLRLRFHDLRGTAATILAEGGASSIQIAAITGHTFQSAQRILESYTARTETLANGGIDAFVRAESGAFANRLQTRPAADKNKK